MIVTLESHPFGCYIVRGDSGESCFLQSADDMPRPSAGSQVKQGTMAKWSRTRGISSMSTSALVLLIPATCEPRTRPYREIGLLFL
jgi:hypothetical protein